jgi:glutathione S-transferase
MYRLHGFCQSGNTFKVAFMLRALHQPWEAVFVDYMKGGATRDPAWRGETNEMGEAPVLDDGPKRLTQSGAILTYLARKHGAYGGRNDDEQLEVLRWILFDNHKFTSYFATYRFMKAFGATAPDPAVMAFLKSRIDGAFGIADKHLATRPYMVGDAPTIADISMCAYLCYPKEESGYDIPAQFPNVAKWLDRVRAIDGWASPYDVLPGDGIAPKW